MPQRVFITGGTKGLGAALARYYADRGALVGITSRDSSLAAPPGVTLYHADVRDPISMERVANVFLAQLGVPDIVIANAGISVGTLAEAREDLAVFEEVMDVNLFGALRTFQPFIAPMRDAGTGVLVGISSVAAVRGLPGASAYSASKASLLLVLESLRVELRGTGVRTVGICPGYIRTAMTADNAYPMPFMMDADDAAARIARGIVSGRNRITVPWQMAWVSAVLRSLPDTIYDFAFARAGRKARRVSA